MDNYKKLQETLRMIFEMDKADLDFGIYRIMNQKRKQIEEFLDKTLPNDIKQTLVEVQGLDSATIQKELDEKIKGASSLGVDPDTVPAIIELRNKLKATDTASLEQDIFSHLTNFFKRYYEGGDFISLRRYKKDVYAIPYEGEEVKLHWANHDQYYIKSSEYLKNYNFKFADKKVQFQLKEASTEQNNNKAQNNMERRFAIYTAKPVEIEDNTLFINFTYELYPKATKQDELTKKTLEVLLQNIPSAFIDVLQLVPTATNQNRTLLEKHIDSFVARNTFDYFIHKDLGQFLRRELDFYIKNEVLAIDDIGTTNNIDQFTSQIAKIKALKTVADKIITFLAQVEDFQKKLWLKKKFVTSTNYCITLDRIPTSYYDEIFDNKAQLEEWNELFDVTITNKEQLKEEQYLLLDTKYFTEEFKDRLLAEFDNLDEQTDGLLINSENFQALNLMQEKYKEKVKGVYVDPPYNAKSSEIAYKNTFKHSSWLSFIFDRVSLSRELLQKEIGIFNIAIDENEQERLGILLSIIFNDYQKTCVTVIHNPSGQQGDNFSYTHEYSYFIYPNGRRLIGQEKRSADEADIRNLRDVTGEESKRGAAKNCFFPIYIKDNQIISFGDVSPDNYHPQMNEVMDDGTIAIYPIDPQGIERKWRFARQTIDQIKDELFVSFINKRNVYDIKRAKTEFNYKTVWTSSEYFANNHGTQILNNILGKELFSYPKSINTVVDSLKAIEFNSKSIIFLDYFAGSGTTGHATIKLNRADEDEGNRKYILVEMGTYFDTVTKPRIQKVIYSDNWKNGKPQDKMGISQIFKYQTLESYEDTLNNLELKLTNEQSEVLDFDDNLKQEYLLSYMLDVESKEHLFNIKMFENPFSYKLNITQDNEMVPTTVDLVETFNYLIGLYVERVQRQGDIKLVLGTTREGVKTLVIWRNLETVDDSTTESVFREFYPADKSKTLEQIYINGDYNQDLYKAKSDRFKMKLIEEIFFNKMFNISEL